MPATRTATASARCTSTRWRASGRCSAPGCVRIAASRRRSCRSISAFFSSSTTRAGAENPCSAPLALPWSGDVLHHPGSRQEPQGNIDAALAAARHRVIADYFVPHYSHAPMEPPAAVANVTDDRAEIWAPTQNPQAALALVAQVLGFDESQVTLHVMLLGGGF